MLVCPTKASGTERQFASINRSRCFSENVCRVQEKIIKKILSICVSLSAIAFIYISSLFLFLFFFLHLKTLMALAHTTCHSYCDSLYSWTEVHKGQLCDSINTHQGDEYKIFVLMETARKEKATFLHLHIFLYLVLCVWHFLLVSIM